MNQRSAVIFDLDGTLIRHNLDFDSIRTEIGVRGPILEAIDDLDESSRRRAEEILLRHEEEAARSALPSDGAVEVVAALRAKGHPVAILTRNSRRSLQQVLDRIGFAVDATRTRDDGAIKPSAEPVLALCAELHAEPRQSWMVGDYLFDIISGASAGAQTVLMIGENEAPPFADRADHVIRQLPELLPILSTAGAGSEA